MAIVQVRLVGINDVYSLANFPRLATLVATERSREPMDVFLCTVAGDFLAPSLLSSLDTGRGMVDCLNALGVTHVTLGNHEDDLRTEELVDRVADLSATVLLTNIREFGGRSAASAVIDAGGARVGLVGAVSSDPTLFRRPPFGGAIVGASNPAVVAESRLLRASGCSAIIALTHQRLAEDRVLRDTGAVNFIHGGHEHDGHIEWNLKAPIAKAPMNATAAVIASITIDLGARGQALVSTNVRLQSVADYAEDAGMRRRVERHLEPVRSLDSRVLLSLPKGVTLSSARSRTEQTNVGTLVCSRLRDELDADAALFNGGGLRGEGERRTQLTYADLRDEMPFDGVVVVVKLPGRVVQDAVRYSRTTLRGTGGYLQMDDGCRVNELNELVTIAGGPLDTARTYRVAIVRDLLFGMDAIAPLIAFASAHNELIPGATTGIDAKVALLRTFG